MPGDHKTVLTLLRGDEKAVLLAKQLSGRSIFLDNNDGKEKKMPKWLLVCQLESAPRGAPPLGAEVNALYSKTWFSITPSLGYDFQYCGGNPLYIENGVLHCSKLQKGASILEEQRASLDKDGRCVVQQNKGFCVAAQMIAAIEWSEFRALVATL